MSSPSRACWNSVSRLVRRWTASRDRACLIDREMREHRGGQAAGPLPQQREEPPRRTGDEHGAEAPVHPCRGRRRCATARTPATAEAGRPSARTRRPRPCPTQRGTPPPPTTPCRRGCAAPASATTTRAGRDRPSPTARAGPPSAAATPMTTGAASCEPEPQPRPQLRWAQAERCAGGGGETGSECRVDQRSYARRYPRTDQPAPPDQPCRQRQRAEPLGRTNTRVRRWPRSSPARPDAFGVLGGPAVGRGDRGPAVEHVFAVVVAVPAGNRTRVGHIGGDLPERDDRIPPHQRRPVSARRFLQPVRPVEHQVHPTTTRWGPTACCRNSTRVPSHGASVSAAISAASLACENRTVRPLS